MEWIEIKTGGLPDKMVEVLAFGNGDIIQAFHDGAYWLGSRNVTDNMDDGWVNDRSICKVEGSWNFITHWMPLPEKPKPAQ